MRLILRSADGTHDEGSIMRIIRTTIAAGLVVAGLLSMAAPAMAKNAYISASTARYYARDAVRDVHPDAFHVKANCDRRSRSLFTCEVSWVRSHVARRYATARVRGLEREGESLVRTALIVTHG